MKGHSKIACYFCSILLAIIFGACAPATTARQDFGAASKSTAGQSPTGRGEGERGSQQESKTASSALDQLKAGKPPITPASSPLKDAFFDFDRYDLSAQARTVLRGNADWLKSNPSVRVEIEGHCDDRGTSEYNLALGAKRAQTARDYLTTLGISPDRLSTISYGEEIPVCKEQAESCWRQNRRARFVTREARSAS